MQYVVTVTGMLVCAVLAVRATRLLPASLWLAGVSVMAAVILYLIGAYMMAVIELSLSVGLITILLVFAISMAGAGSPDQPLSHPGYILPVFATFLLLIGLVLPVLRQPAVISEPGDTFFNSIFWDARFADVFAQIALIFAGVLGVLGLLTEPRKPATTTRSSDAQAAPELDKSAGHDISVAPEHEAEPELERV